MSAATLRGVDRFAWLVQETRYGYCVDALLGRDCWPR
jgi:hypothetical protein